MSDLRKAAQQALEALEASGGCLAFKNIMCRCSELCRSYAAAVALRAALAQQAEPVQVAERERVASQWDGCVTHQLDTFGPVDIGASIRAGELVEAQQAELDDMLVAMEHAVAQAAAAEREACADICDAHASCEGIAQQCAAAIRARGQA